MPFVSGHFQHSQGGYSYVRTSYRRPSGTNGVLVLVVVALGAVAFILVVDVLLVLIDLVIAQRVVVATALAIGITIAGIVRLTSRGRQQRVPRYLELAGTLARSTLHEKGRAELSRLGRRIPANDESRRIGEESLYRELVMAILADGVVTDHEKQTLADLEKVFAIGAASAVDFKLLAFDGLLAWFGADLTVEQESAMRDVAQRLGLPGEPIDQRLEVFAQRRELERDRLAKLSAQRSEAQAVTDVEQRPAVEVPIKLRRKERCWYSSDCELIQRKKKATKHRQGRIFVTSVRLLFVDERATSIALDAILDVAADPEMGLLRVIKDGRQAPYELRLEQPMVALAHVERSISEL